MGKYDGLKRYLKKSEKQEENLNYDKIEKIIGSKLPQSAYKYREWWANGGHIQADAWLNAGWKISSVELGKFVTLRKEGDAKTAGVYERCSKGGRVPMDQWKEINGKINECCKLGFPEKVIDCLMKLFETTNDGMVAKAIGDEYAKLGNDKETLNYYKQAENLLPIPKYKALVTEAINRIRNKADEKKDTKYGPDIDDESPQVDKVIEELAPNGISLAKYNPLNTLFIVSCTKTKVWDTDPAVLDFVPAKYAYRGKRFINFIRWAEEQKIESKGFIWIILSGKYGFIEPWHPISRYDITFTDPGSYPISDESLQNQTNQMRWWRDNTGKVREIRIIDGSSIIFCVNCGEIYLRKIGKCFPMARLIKIDFA